MVANMAVKKTRGKKVDLEAGKDPDDDIEPQIISEIAESEERLRALIENNDDGIAVFNATGKIIFASPAAASILGYDVDEMLAIEDFPALTHPDDKAMFDSRFTKLTKPGSSAKLIFRVRGKYGNYRWVDVIAKNATDNPAIDGIIVNYRDISERVRAVEYHRQAESATTSGLARQAAFFDTALDGIVIIDEAGVVIEFNPAAERIFGYKRTEAVGAEIAELIIPLAYRDAHRRGLAKYLKTGHGKIINKQTELTALRKNGKEFPVELSITRIDNGEPANFMGTLRDITERKATEERLRESRERLELAEQVSNLGTFEWRVDSGQFVWSPGQAQLHGMKPETFSGDGDDWQLLILEEDMPRVTEELQKAVEARSGFETEWRIHRADGQIRDIYAKGQLFFDENGKPNRMLGINMDITERKRYERQKDDFIAVASHELKTPVTSMKMYTAALIRQLERSANADGASMATEIDGQLNRVARLIDDLLDTTKIEAGQLTLNKARFDYCKLLEETIATIDTTTDQHKIVLRGATNCHLVSDRDRISQVLINLIDNAIKYSPNNPLVTVSVRCNETSVTTCVADKGIGISKTKQQHLFERFARVGGKSTKNYPGLGLGLFISAQIVRRLGGKIWVESTKGQGSKFYFSLPLAPVRKASND